MVRQRGIARQVRRELIQSILNSDFGRLSNGLNHRYIAYEVQVNALENPRLFKDVHLLHDGESADTCRISPDGSLHKHM